VDLQALNLAYIGHLVSHRNFSTNHGRERERERERDEEPVASGRGGDRRAWGGATTAMAAAARVKRKSWTR